MELSVESHVKHRILTSPMASPKRLDKTAL
jgi:hypothetical protein